MATALIDLRFGYGLIFFAHLPWQRPDFTNCRVGRIPSGACASRSPPSFRLGSRPFQRFTARRASFGTVLVMNSQGFADGPDISLYPTHSQPWFRVSPADWLPPRLMETSIGPIQRVCSTLGRRSRNFLGSIAAFLLGLGLFSPSGCRHPILI